MVVPRVVDGVCVRACVSTSEGGRGRVRVGRKLRGGQCDCARAAGHTHKARVATIDKLVAQIGGAVGAVTQEPSGGDGRDRARPRGNHTRRNKRAQHARACKERRCGGRKDIPSISSIASAASGHVGASAVGRAGNSCTMLRVEWTETEDPTGRRKEHSLEGIR